MFPSSWPDLVHQEPARNVGPIKCSSLSSLTTEHTFTIRGPLVWRLVAVTGEDFEARFPDPRHHTISFYLHTWPKKPGQGLIHEKNRRDTGQRWEATVWPKALLRMEPGL